MQHMTDISLRIWNALQQLEVGQVGVFGFDIEPKLLHPLDAPLTESAGARLLQSVSFPRFSAACLLFVVGRIVQYAVPSVMTRDSCAAAVVRCSSTV